MNQDGHENFVSWLLPSSIAVHTNVLAHLSAPESSNRPRTGT